MNVGGAATERDAEDVAAATRDDELDENWNRLTGDMSARVKATIKDGPGLVSAYIGNMTARAMARVAGALPESEYTRAADSLRARGVLGEDGAFARHMSATHRPFDTDLRSHTTMEYFLQGGSRRVAEFRRTGEYAHYQNTDDLFIHMWHKQLSQLARSAWARTSMATGGAATDPARTAAVADHIQESPAFWSRFLRSTQTRDGALVGPDVTARDAALDHGQAVNQLTDSAIKDSAGRHVKAAWGAPGQAFGTGEEQTLAEYLAEHGRPPSMDKLNQVAVDGRPEWVKGPEYVRVLMNPEGMLNHYTNKMFERFIGPQIDWISRQPMFVHAYAKSLKAFQPMANRWLAKATEGGVSAEQLAQLRDTVGNMQHEWAMERALNMVTPFIHNPELRSQFSTLTRNLMPFWFAQEQFYKRWGRTLAMAPWAMRKAQLLNAGFKHMGFIHTDPQTNQEYFVYPGSGVVQDVLTHTLGALGMSSVLPVAGSLVGQVNGLSAGFERPGIPNFGPFVVAPLNQLNQLDPHLTSVIDAVLGRQAAGQGLFKPFLPGDIQRAIDIVAPNWLDHSTYASAQMQAIQYLEATGHGIGTPAVNNLGTISQAGPPVGVAAKPGDYLVGQNGSGTSWVMQADGSWRANDPNAQQQFMNRVQNWARIFLLTRTLFGFSGAAAPEMQFNPANVHNDLQTYMKELPFNEAMAAFLAQHPDATPYTVFQTKTGDGQPPPATAPAMAFIADNAAFMSTHRNAGSYFVPLAQTKGPFDLAAYQEQLAEGYRLKKTPQQFYNDVVYAMSANTYFNALANKNALMARPPAGLTQGQVSQQWSEWSKVFMQANPVFAQALTTSAGALNRAQIMEDVGKALNDPHVPPGPQTDDIATLYAGWRNWQAMITPQAGTTVSTVSSATKSYLDEQFTVWAEQYVAAHPDVAALYDKAIKPGLTPVLDALAAAGVQV
jgi:hypothetical protein